MAERDKSYLVDNNGRKRIILRPITSENLKKLIETPEYKAAENNPVIIARLIREYTQSH